MVVDRDGAVVGTGHRHDVAWKEVMVVVQVDRGGALVGVVMTWRQKVVTVMVVVDRVVARSSSSS